MKVKLLINLLPNGQTKQEKDKQITKTIEIDNLAEDIRFDNIF